MKCPYCNGSGWDDEHMIKCLKCEKGIINPTHQEYIQNCTTEELAEWIKSVIEHCRDCGRGDEQAMRDCPFGEYCAFEIMFWLKEKKE